MRGRRAARIDRRQASACFEWLESRRMLASAAWAGGVSGDWDVATNWNPVGVPNSATVVSIATSGATVTIGTGESDSAGSLSIAAGATLSMPWGSSSAATTPTTNLLANSDFELPVAGNSTTSPATWGTWGSSYLSTQYAYTGAQSLVLSGSNSGVSQPIASAAPGVYYTAAVDAMTPATSKLTGGAAYLQMEFFNSSGGEIGSTYSYTMLTASSATGGPLAGSVGNQGWNDFHLTELAPSGTVSAQGILEFYCNPVATGSAFCDDFTFGPDTSALVVGTSTTSGSISNSGTLLVGPANTVTISGTLAQTSTGTLDIQLGGAPATGSFGLVNVLGTTTPAATLAGTLEANIINGYTPSTTDIFTPIEFDNEAGSFASESLPSGSGYQFAAAVTFTNVMISAAPTATLTATVNASSILHAATTNLLGINMAYWDPDAGTTQTQQMLNAAGLDMYRFPGGSSSDDYHFNDADNYYTGSQTFAGFVQAITADGGTGLVTLDYGSGSPQEAAAELAYLDGSPTDTTSIGNGIEWNDSTSQWQTVNWETVGYWASLRGASPLATNDGLNFLRVEHSAAFTDIKYWEVGNEEYGGWEIDHHGTLTPADAGTGAQHDPATYAAFCETFASLATTILKNAGLPQSTISIGIDSGDPTGGSDNDWTKNVLTDGLADGFVPGFISDHSYMQGPGQESDSFLLDDTVSNSASVLDWSTRYADYQTVLGQTLGSQASSVQVMATEYNSVYTNPGKQSTSLVNGLFLAESVGSLLESGYTGGFVWDLRNGYSSSGENNSNLLYGWREGGDYGQLGTAGDNSPPTTGPYIAYPGYYALQLASEIIQSGGQVVSTTSNYSDLDVYAVKESSGDLALMVININPAASLTEQFDLTGFPWGGAAEVWQYGVTQDRAQSQSSNGASGLANVKCDAEPERSEFQLCFPRLLDDRAQPESVADRGRAGGRRAQSGHRQEHGPERAGRLQRRSERPHVHVGNDRHAARRGTVFSQRHQCGGQHDGHLQQGGSLCLPGDDNGPRRTDRDQHGERDGGPDPDDDRGESAVGDPSGDYAAIRGNGIRSVRQCAGDPTGVYLVVDRQRQPHCGRTLHAALCLRDCDRRGGQRCDQRRPPPSPFPGKLNGFRPALPRGPPAAIGRTRPPTT